MPAWASRSRSLVAPVATFVTLSVSGTLRAGTVEKPDVRPPVGPSEAHVVRAPKTVPSPKAREAVVPPEDRLDYDTPRLEPAGFPLLGGDSDIGFEFGAVGTLTRFGGGVRPYAWNLDLLVAASVKSGPDGAEIVQQNYVAQLDVPGLEDGHLRVNPAVYYERTINEGYYGIGNATPGVPPPTAAAAGGRFFEYDIREARLRELTRITWQRPWSMMVATTLRYDVPNAYPQSRLAQDVAGGAVRGYRDLTLAALGLGVIYDTRDNEYFPHQGAFYQAGFRGIVGFPTEAEVRYGAFGANLATYAPLGLGLVLAGRVIVDAQFGSVPFYDLHTGGPFWTYAMIGGGQAVRGVPIGRYSGPLKALGNIECRSLFAGFRLLGQRFRVGADVFFDAGRLWSDYSFTAPSDGDGIGIKWGAGGGAYLVWGQAAIFRLEAAYSPDALSENPNLPVGIYVQDGVMF